MCNVCSVCLDCRVSWVRVPPRAALFSLKKSVVLGAVDLHLCYLSPHYDSCIHWLGSVFQVCDSASFLFL